MEEILVPLIVFSFIALIVKMSLDYGKWKRLHKDRGAGALTEGSDNSLGVSELKALIQDAVEEANIPLSNRIARLEERLDAGQLLEAAQAPKRLEEAIRKDSEIDL